MQAIEGQIEGLPPCERPDSPLSRLPESFPGTEKALATYNPTETFLFQFLQNKLGTAGGSPLRRKVKVVAG